MQIEEAMGDYIKEIPLVAVTHHIPDVAKQFLDMQSCQRFEEP